MVVASVLMSMGMMMMSPAIVACPSRSCCSCWWMAGTC
jgi:flagellar biosynthesis protein FliP